MFHQNFFDIYGNVYSVVIPSMEYHGKTVELKTIYANYAALYSSLKGPRKFEPVTGVLDMVKNYKTKEQYDKLCLDRKKEFDQKWRLYRIKVLERRFFDAFLKNKELLKTNVISYVFDKMEKNNDFCEFYNHIIDKLIAGFTKKHTFEMMAVQFVDNKIMDYIKMPTDSALNPILSMTHIEQELKKDFMKDKRIYERWLYRYAKNYTMGLKDPKYIHV
jgi:hypothetical protein